MYSQLFCGTLETSTLDLNHEKEVDFVVKVYQIELSKFHNLISDRIDVLSASERNRADRFHFKKDRNRFIICRSLLKVLLAKHIGLDVDKILLEEDNNKKPYLPSHPTVFFNLTHSGDYALIAIANSPIGVDIEFINKEFNYQDVVPTVFNTLEINEIINSKDKHLSFYNFWTRKEAIVKAIGKGIDDDLIKIPATNGIHAVPSSLVCDFEKLNVFSFPINDNYVGAIALTKDIINFNRIVFSPLPTRDNLNFLIFRKNVSQSNL